MATSLFYEVLEIAKREKCENMQTMRDLLSLARNELKRDKHKGLIFTKHYKALLDKKLKEANVLKGGYYNLYFQTLVAETPYSLDSYFQALEFNRPINEMFYLPRRKQLLPLVHELERLLIDDELDELFLSMPPRVGKTTLVLFVISWKIGIDPESSNLYSSCSGILTNAFYKGLYEILTDDVTYTWGKIFKDVKWDKMSFCNSKECYLDTGRIKRYHSFTGRSIDAESLNGACDCDGILIADDLVSGIEEALSKERLGILNMKVNSNLMSRAKMRAKILWIGTRWSIIDPIGKRIEALENTSKRYKIYNMPALNENGESNFEYLYDKGYSTQYYLDLKQTFEDNGDQASFYAVYQQEPVERSGLLFPADELNYFNGYLPSDKPDRVFGFCDVAFGGGDNTVLPILYKYGEELYCVDFVCDNGDKTITQPKVAKAIYDNQMTAVQFESNNGGQEYKEKVEEILLKNYKSVTNITTIRAFHIQAKGAESKQIHIFDRAPDIRAIYFLDPKKQNGDYRRAMLQLTSYTIQGNARKKKDDVADALAKSIDMDRVVEKKNSIKIVQRLF